MNKKLLLAIVILVVALGIYYGTKKDTDAPGYNYPIPGEAYRFDPKNATYTIDGQTITLVNGVSEIEAAPGSASKITTRYFGNEAEGDLNNDNQNDLAYLITSSTGGSGLFYYAVVAIKTDAGYKITNPFFIGDRIAPQSTTIIAEELHVNYAERKPNEPMTAQPSVGAVTLLKVTPEGVLEGLMK